jgi:hypothetical protein
MYMIRFLTVREKKRPFVKQIPSVLTLHPILDISIRCWSESRNAN